MATVTSFVRVDWYSFHAALLGVIITCVINRSEIQVIYGYARVSTRAQHLESQIEELEKASCEKIYSEKLTGTKATRPEFQKLLSVLEQGDT